MSEIFSSASVGAGIPLVIGESQLVWDETDANANHLKIDLPAGDATISPTLSIGIGLSGQDLALFNGATEPGIALFNEARTKAVSIRWSGTFFNVSSPIGSAQLNFTTPLNISAPVIMGSNLNWQFYNGSGSAFIVNSSGFLRLYGSNNAIYIGSTGTPSIIASPTNGDMYINNELEVNSHLNIGGNINHDGSNIGFFGTAPAAQAAAYTPTNVSTDRSYDADATTVAELADVLGTLISDLQSYGLLQ